MEEKIQFRILIVNDKKSEIDALTHILEPNYTIMVAKSWESLQRKINHSKPDLILLSTHMLEMTGFEMLTRLRAAGLIRETPVIFLAVLNSVEEEEKGLLLGAVDYIRKPFNSAIIKARINVHLHITEQFQTKDNAFIILKTKQEIRKIQFHNLIYVEICGHWLNFYLTGNQKISIYASLKKYEEILLSDLRFAKCHRSYIVNMDFIEAVDLHNTHLKGCVSLPISKGKADFKQTYRNWLFDDDDNTALTGGVENIRFRCARIF